MVTERGRQSEKKIQLVLEKNIHTANILLLYIESSSASVQATLETVFVILFLIDIIDILRQVLRQQIKIKLNYAVGWQSHGVLTGLLQYLSKNTFIPKLGGEKSCQNPRGFS